MFDPRGCPHKLIYRTYALIKFYDDKELLEYGYAPMLKALEYSQFFRPAGSHLPMDPPSNPDGRIAIRYQGEELAYGSAGAEHQGLILPKVLQSRFPRSARVQSPCGRARS